ncbi:MAG TPA: DUF885 domain-containing protein [Terriglobales bacterium]|nr:DUF885 domain-containing protein [Terriglobales bacterium]
MAGFAADAGVEARRKQLNAFLEDEWEYALRTNPEFATYVGDSRYNDKLSDHSPEAVERDLKHAQEALKRIEAFDTTGFPEQEKLNKELAVRELREQIESTSLKEWEMPVNQMGGIHQSYASMPSQLPFRTVKDYEDYLARLHQMPHAFDQTIAVMCLGMKNRMMPPRYLLEKVATQAQDIADKSPEASPFAKPVLKFPSGIPEADQKRLRDAALAAVKNELGPAYSRFAKFVRTEYAPKGRTEYGVWALPNGDAIYRFDVRQMTTTDLGPEKIHRLGLKQVEEIEAEMLKIARQQGFSDLKSFNQHIRTERKLYATSGQQLLDLYQHYTDQMYAKLPQLFGHLPQNKLEVVPMEDFRAPDEVPADYSPGAPKSGRPGRINVNEYAPEKRLLLNAEAIAYHEGIPGHHLQFTIAAELPELPPFRKYAEFTAYSEGWAFYSERLAKEVGFYQDPYSEYGRLENEMWRAVRLVVDTGVHYKHWSRDQMLDFFRQQTAMDEQNIVTEVDRYIVWPGQALAYKLGQMKIIELRERAHRELGQGFDIRTFHDAVLAEGPVPLDVLEKRMDQWIAAQKGNAGQ